MKQTINTFPISPISGSPLAVKARLAADTQFIASTGELVPAGNSQTNYVEYTLSSLGNGRVFPTASDIDSTTDSSNPNATYTMYLMDSRGKEIGTLFECWMFDASLGPSILFSELEDRNVHKIPLRDDQVYSKMQVDNLLLNRTFASPATVSNLGVVRISGISTTVVSTDDRRMLGMYNVTATAIGANGNGVFDNVSVLDTLVNTTMQITGAGGDAYFPEGTYFIGSDMLVPANVRLNFDPRAKLKIATGQVVTIVGAIKAGPYQIFTGLGTVSIAESQVTWWLHVHWFGAVGDDSTNNAAALNAASNCLVTSTASGFGNGFLEFGPGIYRIGSTWTVGSTTGGGDGLGAFTGISWIGSNGLVGTRLKWTGSTSGQMVKVVRGRHLNILNIAFFNGVAVGSTIGLWLSGPPGLGEQTSFGIISNCTFRGFFVSAQAGDVGGSAAGELIFNTCRFEENATGGLAVSSGNTLVITYLNCSFYGNTSYGLNLSNGSGDIQVVGGGFSGNTGYDVGLSLGWNGTVSIEGARFEIAAAHSGSILNNGNTGSLRLANCRWRTTDTVPAWAVVQNANFVQFESCDIGADNEDGWIAYSGGANAKGSLKYANCRIQNTTQLAGLFLLETGTTGQVGMRYQSFGCYYTVAGVVTKFDDIIAGIVGTNQIGAVIRVAQSKVTNGVLTGDTLAFLNQLATPSVKYGNRFTTGNSGATLYSNFLGGASGQVITIIVTDANSTFVNGATIANRSGANIVAGNGLTYSYQLDGTVWRQIN
jgi:hypothetical protein